MINVVPLTTEAYETIKKKIIDLQLKPGEIILVQQLAKNLNISRTPVREALIRLTQEGLVEYAEGKKFRVTELTLDVIMEIYEVRQALESVAIDGLRGKITEKEISGFEEILTVMNNALKEGDYDTNFENDLRFHNYVVEIYGNKTMLDMLKLLTYNLQRVRYITKHIPNRVEDSTTEHQLILDCIKNEDYAGAKKALNEHLENVKLGIKKLVKDRNVTYGYIVV